MVAQKLIINADDLGFNKEVTDGIYDSHTNGVVTSTTMMVNMPAADYAAARIGDYPDLSVGIHLNLTTGTPLCDPSEISTIVDGQGQFLNHRDFMRKANAFKLDATHLEKELSAQLDKFQSYDLKPTHADSHHHSTYCLQVFPILLKLLKRYGLDRMRSHRGWYHRDRLVTGPAWPADANIDDEPTALLTIGDVWPQLGTDRFPFFPNNHVIKPDTYADWPGLMEKVSGELSQFVQDHQTA